MKLLRFKIHLICKICFKAITSCFFNMVWTPVCRQVTSSSSAVPSLHTPTGSRGANRLSSCSSWTVCGRSCGSFLAPFSLTNTFWWRCSNTLTPPSSALFWETAPPRGQWLACFVSFALHFADESDQSHLLSVNSMVSLKYSINFIFCFLYC